MSRTSMRLTRSMLPHPARDLVPAEVSDSQLAFWWAAFELGRSAAGSVAAAAINPAAASAAQVIDGDGDDLVIDGDPDWVDMVVDYAIHRAPAADPVAVADLIKGDRAVVEWIEQRNLPSERVWTMSIDGILEAARLVKDPTAGMGE